jgi:hypothetical protein
VQPALASIVHGRQGADYEQRHGEYDQYGGFHRDFATAGPKPTNPDFSWFEMNPP